MKDLQRLVQDALDRAVRDGHETGVQFVAYRHGELQVDAWAGSTGNGSPVSGETLFPVFSTTKGIAATCIHLLVERGQLDYETRVSSLWPQFGGQGKASITVRHVLNHSAGLARVPAGVTYADIANWQVMCEALAAETPATEPGSVFEYHALTYGWLLGEILRLVDGRHFSRFLQEEICGPLGLDSLFCGLPTEKEPLVATLEDPYASPGEVPATPTAQVIPHFLMPLSDWMNLRKTHGHCQPASNGIMNARGIARHYASLLPGGVDGVQLLPEKRIDTACTRRAPDGFMAMGYRVGGFGAEETILPHAFGHRGHGGSMGFADKASGWAVGWTRNKYSAENTVTALLPALLQHT